MKRHEFSTMVVVSALGLLLSTLVVGSIPSPASLAAPPGTTRYVRPGGLSSGNCDVSWANACELQTALDVAVAGDEIWVAAGVYTPTLQTTPGVTRTATFSLVSGVAIYGGFPSGGGTRDWQTNVTVLSGDIDGDDTTDPNGVITTTAHIAGSNSYHVVTGSGVTETAVLDGFTITGGNADADPWNGGGMFNDGGSPTLRNLTFRGNQADGHGGGMYNDNSSPALTNCQFVNNDADRDGSGGGDGGGMYNELNSSPVLSGTHFYSNTANYGGGMHDGNGSHPKLTGVIFSGNSATADGGGMHNSPYSSPALTNTVFFSNTAGADGGGMSNGDSNPVLTNVTFSGNEAAGWGGGMYNWQSSPTLRNCILWDNLAISAGDQISNSGGSMPTIAWSDIQGSGGSLAWDASLGTDSGGNIDADPLFVGEAAGDLHLGLDSPAVDRGNNDAVTVTTDLDGYPRIGNGRVDMGAYEFQYPVPPSSIHVDAGATGARDGSDWPDALISLRFALAWAGVGVSDYGLPGVEIRVAEGIYKPDPSADREATFQLHSGVALKGGFPSGGGARDWQTHVITLSGDLLGNDLPGFTNYGDNSYHVVTGSGTDASAVLDGFTISGGNAEGVTENGGGMVNWGGSPTLRNSAFRGNQADGHGGGMYNSWASPELTEVDFIGNSAWYGGGMSNRYSNPMLTNCTFVSNSATGSGGGMNNYTSSPTLTGCTFTGNRGFMGGGMCNQVNSNPVLTQTHFFTNTVVTTGGGMYNSNSTPTAKRITFRGNSAGQFGGGMTNHYSNPVLIDSTFSLNSATLDGGGMYNGYASPELTEVDFIGNAAYRNGGGMRNWNGNPMLIDCTFEENSATNYGGGMYNEASSPMLSETGVLSNTANHGGGMHNGNGSSPTLTDVTLSGNGAGADGGGMYNVTSSPTLTGVDVVRNTATNGGGIYNRGGSLAGNGATVISNTADYGGGMYNTDSPTVTQVTLISNTAVFSGGGMYNDGGAPTLSAITLTLNTAQNGGGMYNNNSSPTAKRITFSHDAATTSGGGVYNQTSGPLLVNASFVSNTATYGGGGMYNRDCPLGSGPRLVNTLFNNNAATGTAGNEGSGGGMYNEGSSPELANVTFGNNTATQYGGGIADFSPGLNVSTPHLDNCVLWGNTSGSGTLEQDQIYDADGSGAVYGSTCTIEGSEHQASPFVDADGADGIPGTADDDLRLAHTSEAIDGGDASLSLLVDILDLDGDTYTTDELPFDLDGNIRRYADENLDGLADPVGAAYSERSVDQGAYEAGCYAWHMRHGARKLADGQKYRLGFHHEIEYDVTAETTISDTLASYAAERAAGNLDKARKAYEFALDCATTASETNEAVAGLLKVTWEQATGALLEGNEEMVRAMDLTDGQGMAVEMSYLETAIDRYTEATDGYLLPLAREYQGDFLAAMGISRTHQLTYTTAITQVDVQRFAAASAKKSRARLELAERQFRSGDPPGAKKTLLAGKEDATVELALLNEIWAGVVEDVNYHALERNMSDMDRLWDFLAEDKNPLGYSPEWIPIHYRPGIDENNYVRVDELARQYLEDADEPIREAKELRQAVHDNYTEMQQRYWDIEGKFDEELEILCGVDWQRCGGGTLADQISAVEQAQLRLGRVLEQMNVLNKRIQIEVEARDEEGVITQYTAKLISTDGDEYSSMVEQEQEIALGWQIAKGVGQVVSNMVRNKAIGAMAFGTEGVLGKAGSLLAGLGSAVDMVAGFFGVEEEPPKEEKLLEFQAWQNAQMVICDGAIADVEFEKHIKELFLEYGLLDIDYAIALESLHQELLRLDGLKTRVEYLLAEKARAMAFTDLLYRDPGHRVLRDYYTEMAQDSFDTALDYTFRAGRALEYEANLAWSEFECDPPCIPPDPDATFGIRDIVDLIQTRIDTKDVWNRWSEDKNPNPKTTIVRLSRALNYEDTDTATAEEQFNAFVRAHLVNESLRFTFDTSIHMGNPFFDHCLFNDRIESVRVRIRGADLGLEHPEDGVTVRLGWGDVGCANTDCGTTFIRSENAWYMEDPANNGMYLDDLRAYTIQPKLATIQAAVGESGFPEEPNTDLALRSVANNHWTLFIDGTLPANQGLNLDNVDEIELIVEHEAYSSQAPMCQSGGSLSLAPIRPYRPMGRVLDPNSSPLLAALAEGRGVAPEDTATSLSGLYAGTVAITSPQYMPALDMNLVLMENGGSLSGYLDPAQSLHVPVVDEATGHGPAVSGSWSGDGFSLQSEVFTTTLSPGLTVTRQVILHSGVISDGGEYLTGAYTETLAGLTPEPMVIYGGVELWRLLAAVAPSASLSGFPVVGTVPLTVTFSDFSAGDPTAWAWDFGDGDTSTEQHPTHTYAATGTYTVTLTVSNTLGVDTTVMPGYVTVLDKPRIYLPLVMRN